VTHVTCRLTAKNLDQLRNPTLGNRVWATFTFLSAAYEFQPVAVETHETTISFISELGRKISEYSGDRFDSRYFFQRVIVLIQRYNSILFRETFPAEDKIDS